MFTIGSPVLYPSSVSVSDSTDDSFSPYAIANRNRPHRVCYTESESELESAGHDDAHTSPWKDCKIKCFKYVDDCLLIEKIDFKAKRNENVSSIKAVKTQNHYLTVKHNASQRGMKLNTSKTKMLCISAAKSYKPEAFLYG